MTIAFRLTGSTILSLLYYTKLRNEEGMHMGNLRQCARAFGQGGKVYFIHSQSLMNHSQK